MSSTSIKKVSKSILKEAKAEEAGIKHATKDLETTQKSVVKAQKAVAKAESILKSSEQKAIDALQSINKAEHKHNIAVTNLHTAEKNVELMQMQDAMLQKELLAQKAQLEAALLAKEAHEQERATKLSELASA